MTPTTSDHVTSSPATTATSAYLDRLGLDAEARATLDTLRRMHRRHLERVPYENLGIMLGRPPSVDPGDSLRRVGEVGRAGYCFHQNGAMETALRDLGFTVSRWHGHVWTGEELRGEPSLNHLALVVEELPTDGNPSGRWWVDVGLGDAFRDPLPLVAGDYDQGGFRYSITRVFDDGWSFRHDRAGSFTGMEVTTRPVDASAVAEAHARLSTPPDGRFTRLLVVQRRHESGVDSLRGCLLVRIEADGRTETELASYDVWRDALADGLHLPLDDLPGPQLEALWRRSWAAHLKWTAAGRP